MRGALRFVAMLAGVPAIAAAEPEALDPDEEPPPPPGFYLHSADGTSTLKIGGFIQFDGRYFVDDRADPHVDQFAFRSIRPDFQGTVSRYYDYRLFVDFAGAKLVIEDAYTDVHYSDVLELRVGKFKVPFGLERLQAEWATTFVERGLPTQVAPNRDLGAMVFGQIAGGTLEYQLGMFDGVPDGAIGDGDDNDAKDVAARIFVRPFAQTPYLGDLGAGGAVTRGYADGTPASPDLAAYKSQGQTTFLSYKTGTSLADTAVANGLHWRATAQGYYYVGPVGMLAEYVRSAQHVELAGVKARSTIDSWQVLGQWVITGEPATYHSVVPRHPFDPDRGTWGAFDLAARATELRLVDDAPLAAGMIDPTKSARKAVSLGGGADWFLNRNLRVELDFDHTAYTLGAKAGDREAETSIIGRVQTVF